MMVNMTTARHELYASQLAKIHRRLRLASDDLISLEKGLEDALSDHQAGSLTSVTLHELRARLLDASANVDTAYVMAQLAIAHDQLAELTRRVPITEE